MALVSSSNAIRGTRLRACSLFVAVISLGTASVGQSPQVQAPEKSAEEVRRQKRTAMLWAAAKPLMDTVPREGAWPRVSPNAAAGFLVGFGEQAEGDVVGALRQRFGPTEGMSAIRDANQTAGAVTFTSTHTWHVSNIHDIQATTSDEVGKPAKLKTLVAVVYRTLPVPSEAPGSPESRLESWSIEQTRAFWSEHLVGCRTADATFFLFGVGDAHIRGYRWKLNGRTYALSFDKDMMPATKTVEEDQ